MTKEQSYDSILILLLDVILFRCCSDRYARIIRTGAIVLQWADTSIDTTRRELERRLPRRGLPPPTGKGRVSQDIADADSIRTDQENAEIFPE